MDINNISSLKPIQTPTLSSGDHEKLEKAAKEFEGIFMDIVMKSMRSTVEESDFMGDSKKAQFFQEMLDSEYSKASTERQGLGLAKAIVKQLSQATPLPGGKS